MRVSVLLKICLFSGFLSRIKPQRFVMITTQGKSLRAKVYILTGQKDKYIKPQVMLHQTNKLDTFL